MFECTNDPVQARSSSSSHNIFYTELEHGFLACLQIYSSLYKIFKFCSNFEQSNLWLGRYIHKSGWLYNGWG